MKIEALLLAAAVGVAGPPVADVVSVEVRGEPGAYRFEVGVRSPDTGCEQYADWWEVVDEEGRLLYRRILTHSHVDEQPFVRSGGPIPIDDSTEVRVRAHMHPTGYDGQVMLGSVSGGFAAGEAERGFASGLAKEPPLPEGCRF